MKSTEQINRLSFDELEAICGDDSVKTPSNLSSDVQSTLVYASLKKEEGKAPRLRMAALSAAAVAAVLCIAVFSYINRTPKDTFNDPYLAYAQIEKAFDKISDNMGKGMQMAQKASPVIETTIKVFE